MSTRSRTQKQRLVVANETKFACLEHTLERDVATKILFTMLDNYVEHGTTYIGKELKFSLPCAGGPRKYVINLYNDIGKKDVVVIKRIEDE